MFKIQTNNNSVIKHQIGKEISKISARDILKTRSGQEELKSTDSWWKNRIDWQEAAKNSKQYKKDYERTAPETLSAQAKDAMWRKAKQLKDEFTVGMLSREELHPVKGFMENGTMKWVVDEEKMRANRSTERESAWLSKNQAKIAEFKNLMRHLDPDNPTAGDIEKYRTKGRGK